MENCTLYMASSDQFLRGIKGIHEYFNELKKKVDQKEKKRDQMLENIIYMKE